MRGGYNVLGSLLPCDAAIASQASDCRVNILFITQYFAPEEPFIRGLPLVRSLQESGHHVQVLTGFPCFPEGRIYPGYRVRPVAARESPRRSGGPGTAVCKP